MRRDFYDEYFRLEDRHWWFVGRRRIVLAVLDAHLSSKPAAGRQMLDLGCGTGTMLGYLRQFGDARGVEADERAVHFCHARGEDRVQLLESELIPFPDRSFDLVTALDVLEHIEDDEAMLREVQRVLKPGGSLLATVPSYAWMWGPQDVISHHFRRYAGGELEEKIRGTGLELLRSTHFNSILFPPIAAVRLARRLRPLAAEPTSDFALTGEGRLNRVLEAVFSSEARWLRRHRFPIGVSLLVLAGLPRS